MLFRSKGFYQVMFRYGRELIAMMFKKREMFVSCYDMFMTLAPATLLSIGCILLNLIFLAYGATDVHMLRRILPGTLGSIAFAGVNFYLLMFSIGFITLVTEWNKILALSAQCSKVGSNLNQLARHFNSDRKSVV